jgi:hypothetical protein
MYDQAKEKLKEMKILQTKVEILIRIKESTHREETREMILDKLTEIVKQF